ncbi:hypothetical protein H5410_022431 [Solanum commersonii]|uniref:Uncharacterized protein n=1 Tax=Solanum commersonii TaxID=4109 RepID=A0A9J5ZJA2_SOLCO|nr:hypothetical protein H5410_022431 [Solanum commersonii]
MAAHFDNCCTNRCHSSMATRADADFLVVLGVKMAPKGKNVSSGMGINWSRKGVASGSLSRSPTNFSP